MWAPCPYRAYPTSLANSYWGFLTDMVFPFRH